MVILRWLTRQPSQDKVNTFRQESTNLGKSQYFKIEVNSFSTKTLSTSQPKLGKVTAVSFFHSITHSHKNISSLNDLHRKTCTYQKNVVSLHSICVYNSKRSNLYNNESETIYQMGWRQNATH